MTYSGHTRPGGPAHVRELPGLQISKLTVGPMENNSYLLRDVATGWQLLIDAAAEPEQLLDLAGPAGLSLLVTTHRHPDHWQALAAVAAATGAQTMASAADAAGLPVAPQRLLGHGDIVELGSTRLEAIELRGHTDAGIAVYYDDPYGHGHLFTGDSLFPGGVGRTQSPEAFRQLIDDVQERVFDRFGDETWVYPGHGADTTLGAERPQLAEWRARGW